MKPMDRGERGAQLVGDRGDELVLDPQRAHEVGDVLVGERRAGEAARASSRTTREETDSARRVSGSEPTQISWSSNSSPWAGAVGRHLLVLDERLAVLVVDLAELTGHARRGRAGRPAA